MCVLEDWRTEPLSKVAGEEVRKLTKAKSSMALWVMVRILGFIIVLSCPSDTFYYVRTYPNFLRDRCIRTFPRSHIYLFLGIKLCKINEVS